MARKLTAGLVVLALAAVAAAPAVLGWQAERIYTRIVERVNADNPDIDVRMEAYERGWLGATARYSVRIAGPYRDALRDLAASERRLALDGRDRIRHGPWAGGRVAMARIDSELRMAGGPGSSQRTANGGDPVLRARTLIDLAGDVRARFHVADRRIEASAGNPGDDAGHLAIEWRDVSGEAGLVDGVTRLAARAGEMTLEDGRGGRLALTGVELDDHSRPGGDGLRLGRTELAIERLDVRADDPDRPADMRVEGLTAANETGADGDHAEIGSHLAFERARVGGTELSDARIETRLAHLRRRPLARLQALIAEAQRRLEGGDELDARDVPDAEIRAALDELLRGSPRVPSGSVRVHTPDGRVVGDMHLDFDGDRGFDLDRPLTLLGPLSGNLELSLPRALVRRGLHAGMREQLSSGDLGDDMDARLRRQAEQTIDLLVGARLLDEQDGRLVVRLDKEAGGPALLNGQDVMQLIRVVSDLMSR